MCEHQILDGVILDVFVKIIKRFLFVFAIVVVICAVYHHIFAVGQLNINAIALSDVKHMHKQFAVAARKSRMLIVLDNHGNDFVPSVGECKIHNCGCDCYDKHDCDNRDDKRLGVCLVRLLCRFFDGRGGLLF